MATDDRIPSYERDIRLLFRESDGEWPAVEIAQFRRWVEDGMRV